MRLKSDSAQRLLLQIHSIGPKLTALIFLALLATRSIAVAEPITICPHKQFNEPVGTLCKFTPKQGEELKVYGHYYDNNKNHKTQVILGGGNVSIIDKYFKGNSDIYLSLYMFAGAKGPVKVEFKTDDWQPGNIVELLVISDRSNLRADPPSINAVTGDLFFPWSVTTSKTYVPAVTSVAAQYWGSIDWNYLNGQQWLGYEWTTPCVGKAKCTHTGQTKFKDRSAIPSGKNWLITQVDPDDKHAETEEWDNIYAVKLGDFFEEKIPGIMTAISSSWALPRQLMEFWFYANDVQKDESEKGVDWSLSTLEINNVGWFLDPKHSSKTVRARYDELKDPTIYKQKKVKDELKKLIVKQFKAHPGKTTVLLSNQYSVLQDAEEYHLQHIEHVLGQTKLDIASNFTADPTVAGFGTFSFYAVPRGTATKQKDGTYLVKLNKIAIHVVDSYDFNGEQPLGLGCWTEQPPNVSFVPWSGSKCLSNPDFRLHRKLKARGRDFTVFMTPLIEEFTSPLIPFEIEQ